MKYIALFTFSLLLALSQQSFAGTNQTTSISITGVVKDKATLLPIPNAEVRISKLNILTRTDNDGRFKFVGPFKRTKSMIDTIIVTDRRYWKKSVVVKLTGTTDLSILVSAEKQRLIVTTDIGGTDPDDEQSLIHLLLLSNEIDIEGIICGLAWESNGRIGINVVNSIIDAYGKTYNNLKVHDKGFLRAKYLKSIVRVGQLKARMGAVGKDKNSPGSDLIIAAVDRDDPRPVWLDAWGGANTIAQALWKVQHTRTPEQVKKFIQKIRIYDILGQDDAGAWIAKTFPDIVYIRNKAVYGWAPPDDWVKQNVQLAGPLGAKYPNRVWATEGDSPAFMQLVPNGLSDPNAIDQGNWGGRFGLVKKKDVRSMDIAVKSGIDELKYDPYFMFTNTDEGADAINRWKLQIWNDLAARIEWSIEDSFQNANHIPLAFVNGDDTKQVLTYKANNDSVVKLNASGSKDPDGNNLHFKWLFYKEPSSYKGKITISNPDSSCINLKIPADASGKTIHIILELSDTGKPSLTAYRRIIIQVK